MKVISRSCRAVDLHKTSHLVSAAASVTPKRLPERDNAYRLHTHAYLTPQDDKLSVACNLKKI